MSCTTGNVLSLQWTQNNLKQWYFKKNYFIFIDVFLCIIKVQTHQEKVHDGLKRKKLNSCVWQVKCRCFTRGKQVCVSTSENDHAVDSDSSDLNLNPLCVQWHWWMGAKHEYNTFLADISSRHRLPHHSNIGNQSEAVMADVVDNTARDRRTGINHVMSSQACTYTEETWRIAHTWRVVITCVACMTGYGRVFFPAMPPVTFRTTT